MCDPHQTFDLRIIVSFLQLFKEHGCVSLFMVTERCSSANGANIARLLKRCGQEVPQSLQEIVEITTQASLSLKVYPKIPVQTWLHIVDRPQRVFSHVIQ